MKQSYEKPEIVISTFTTESVITTSVVPMSLSDSAPGTSVGSADSVEFSYFT